MERNTRQRCAIRDVIALAERPLLPQEVLDAAQQQVPGMGIATVVALARGARSLLLLALVAWVGTKIYRRYGEAARQQFDDWVAKSQPQASQVLNALRAVGPDTADLNRSNGTTDREGGASKRASW
jgi:hypothetical protein